MYVCNGAFIQAAFDSGYTEIIEDGTNAIFKMGSFIEWKRSAADEWPTYRHDPARSGWTPMAAPEILNTLWEKEVVESEAPTGMDQFIENEEYSLTGAVVVGGLVVIAAVGEEAQVVLLILGLGGRRSRCSSLPETSSNGYELHFVVADRPA